jgi:hypothetical protein
MGKPQDAARLQGRNGKVWRAYVRGDTQETIAARHNITRGRVSQILTEIRQSIPPEDRATLVLRETEFLDNLRRIALDLVEAGPTPAYSNGKPILMEDGLIAEDHSGRLAAFDRAVKVHERLCKLLGLDAPKESNVTVDTPSISADLEAKIQAARAAVDERLESGAADGAP